MVLGQAAQAAQAQATTQSWRWTGSQCRPKSSGASLAALYARCHVKKSSQHRRALMPAANEACAKEPNLPAQLDTQRDRSFRGGLKYRASAL